MTDLFSYGKSKDAFGWPEDDELLQSQAGVLPTSGTSSRTFDKTTEDAVSVSAVEK